MVAGFRRYGWGKRPLKIEAAKLKEKEPRIIGWMIGFFVLWEIIRMLNIQQNARITFCVDVMEIVLLGRLFPYLKINRHRWYLLFAGAVVVIFLTSAIRPSVVLHQTAPMLQRSLLPYVLAPAVGLLLSEKPLKTLVKIFTAAWTLFFCGHYNSGHLLRCDRYPYCRAPVALVYPGEWRCPSADGS